MVMSLHCDQTWAVASQSYRSCSTYSPGLTDGGTTKVSAIDTAYGKRPEQRPVSLAWRETDSSHGGSNSTAVELSEYGSGIIAQVDPTGSVPSERNVPEQSRNATAMRGRSVSKRCGDCVL